MQHKNYFAYIHMHWDSVISKRLVKEEYFQENQIQFFHMTFHISNIFKIEIRRKRHLEEMFV